MVDVIELPYRVASGVLFAGLRQAPGAVWLDSQGPCAGARYDVLAAHPVVQLSTWGAETQILTAAGAQSSSRASPTALVRDLLLQYDVQDSANMPCAGGVLGYWGYALGQSDVSQTMATARDLSSGQVWPDMALGLYLWVCVVDHQAKRTYLCVQARACAAQVAWATAVCGTPSAAQQADYKAALQARIPDAPVHSNMSELDYATRFAQIKTHLQRGDCYQVNLAQRFSRPLASADVWPFYVQTRQRNPAPYGAYLSTPYGAVLSFSPELFLDVQGQQVVTKPIKGTIARAEDPAVDRQRAAQLAASAKDRAENLMIVDLLRNDLNRICVAGSVAVPALWAIESYPAVHHLVSTVTGRLAPAFDALAALAYCSPGGSITGAPKKRAMAYIATLEPDPRAVYCGTIGWCTSPGNLRTNIAIRTLMHQREQLHCHAGGGIVMASTLAGEYQETFVKVSRILKKA